ncbi:PREDICTED: putative F-box protein At5g36200 [Brassica oleracea var. oleracea]|nr:PREDICTED: putative F-box protein At5g36200 [Brassica oleracea var. oleracea]
MEIMVYDSRVILVRVNLQGVLKGKQGLVELSKKLIGQLNHIMVSDDDGFWLCLPKNGMVKSDPVRFRRCLDLDSNSRSGDSVILSAVREEQLVLLFQHLDTYEIEIRITTKIEEANEVIWRNFLKVDVKPLGFSETFWKFLWYGSFFVDEKKKVALISDNPFSRVYMIGEDNYFKVVAPGEATYWKHVCSYVPSSSVQIRKGPVHARGKRKIRDC